MISEFIKKLNEVRQGQTESNWSISNIRAHCLSRGFRFISSHTALTILNWALGGM